MFREVSDGSDEAQALVLRLLYLQEASFYLVLRHCSAIGCQLN